MDINIKEEIQRLKKEKNAVILAHYYVPAKVQEVADYVGDSYYLSKVANNVNADVIVFCGVYFMGESAKILNPEKIVVMPDLSADCPMAHMATINSIKKVREEYKDVAVVCYINSTAEIKAYSDVCVTSSNAFRVIDALPNKFIYFIPDQNLGGYISQLLPNKTFIFNDGYCHVHTAISPSDLLRKKQEYPKAKVAAHAECKPEVLKLSDFVGSTSGIIDFVDKTDATDFIICTETGIFHELGKKLNGKKLHSVNESQICPDMKKNTLEKLLNVLNSLNNEVIVDEAVIKNSLLPLQRMLDLAAVSRND